MCWHGIKHTAFRKLSPKVVDSYPKGSQIYLYNVNVRTPPRLFSLYHFHSYTCMYMH